MTPNIGHVYGRIPRIVTAWTSVDAGIPVVDGQITSPSRVL